MHDAGHPGCGLVDRTMGTKGRAPTARRIHLGAKPTAPAVDAPNFVLIVEVVLPQPKPTAEKEAFWREFQAGLEARLYSMEADLVLRFVEMPGGNIYFSRKAPPL